MLSKSIFPLELLEITTENKDWKKIAMLQILQNYALKYPQIISLLKKYFHFEILVTQSWFCGLLCHEKASVESQSLSCGRIFPLLFAETSFL